MMDDMDYYDENFIGGDAEVLYDVYDDYELTQMPHYSIKELWADCLIPTVSDGFYAASKLLTWCLLLKVTSTLRYFPIYSTRVPSGVAGIYCLYSFFGYEMMYVMILAVIGYATISTTHFILGKYRGVSCAAVCFLFLMTCELFIVEHTAWHKIRGTQMVLAMKLISLAFDLDFSQCAFPCKASLFCYLFNIGTVIFGPWISYSTYANIHQPKSARLWAWKIVQCLSLSFGFLTLSTCWSSWIFQHISWRWLIAYRDALSFRSSHYFVSYLSEATAVASGISASSSVWGVPVVNPSKIEIPRSLVEVVICWNLPMHFWLKTYVFKNAKFLGSFAAVLLTYGVSSLLHGLNFQLAAVLLSLGFYTYVEYEIRKKLAAIFQACILARKCKKECSHKYKSDHYLVRITNLGFGLLAIFHLAYLGVMFDSSSSSEEEGYSMQHTLEKWSVLNFASHWTALATYIFYILI